MKNLLFITTLILIFAVPLHSQNRKRQKFDNYYNQKIIPRPNSVMFIGHKPPTLGFKPIPVYKPEVYRFLQYTPAYYGNQRVYQYRVASPIIFNAPRSNYIYQGKPWFKK